MTLVLFYNQYAIEIQLVFIYWYCYTFYMDPFFILFYLIVVFLGFSAIYLSLNLFKTYKYDFFRFLNFFIIFSVIFGFFNWIAPVIINTLIKNQINSSTTPFIIMIRNFGYPFLLLKLYFLYRVNQKLSLKPTTIYLRFFFPSLFIFLFILHPITTLMSFKGTLSQLIFLFKLIEGHLLVLIQFILLIILLLKTEQYKKSDPKYSARIFGQWYFIGFSIVVIIMNLKIISHGYYLSIFLFFLIHFPPLIAIKYFLKKNIQFSNDTDKNSSIKNFTNIFNLSEREKEILNLILQNKTNKEIEDLLFISIQTVKNNISNIYKKTGVKSRPHLIRKFDEYA